MTKSLHTLGLIACALKICAGVCFYLMLEIMKETTVDTVKGKKVRWNRPFFGTLLLFSSMSLTLIPYLIFRHNKPGATKVNKYTFINMIIPSVLEFVGQTMFMIGMLYIPMSLSLTLKGARVVFSALLLVTFLKRKLFAFHWTAVVATVIGLAIATIPSLVNPKGETKTVTGSLIGICLVLGGEFIRSMRTVVEEKLMKKLKYDPLLVVGLQGLYAFVLTIPTLCVVNVITGPKGGPLEEWSVTSAQFTGSALIFGLAMTFPITVPGLFISGAYVTKLMSAVHNALTTILTNAIVWILTIIIYYIDNTRSSPLEWWSLLQLCGFSIVLVASLMYDSILRFTRIFTYPLDRAQASGAGTSEKSVLGISSHDNISMSTADEKEASIEEGPVITA